MSHTDVPAGPGVPPAPVGPSTGRPPDDTPEGGPGGAPDGAPSGAHGARAELRPGSTTLLRAAVRPRMLVLLVLLLGAAAVCVRLGAWQLDRAEIRGDSAAVRELAAREAAAPVGLGTVLAPQTTFTGELVGRRVTAQGVYDAAGQLLVGDREHDGRTGYLVLTPLRVTDDGSTGTVDASAATAPVLAVVRGWVATPDDADALAVPTGPVTVTGYLQVTEASGGDGLPAGQVDAISAPDLLNVWGGPIWTGYLVLIGSEPEQAPGLATLPAPTRAGAGLNLQNLAYAAQWWIFGGFALFLWVRLVRDEAAGPWVDDDPSAA